MAMRQRKKQKNKSLKSQIDTQIQYNHQHHSLILFFNIFSKQMSLIVGNPISFIVVLMIVILWAFLGPHFHYSDTWQLVINTSSSIVTFLVVFLIQNTQNRDTEIINLKIDELIKSKKGATNSLINLDALSDTDLKSLEKEYLKIKNKKTGS